MNLGTVVATLLAALSGLTLIVLVRRNRRLRTELAVRSRDLEAVTEQQVFQSQVLERVTEAIIVADADGRVRNWNAGAAALFGRSALEVMGRHVSDAIVHSGIITRQGSLRAAIGGDGEWRGDAQITRSDGQLVFVEATVRAIADAGGVPMWHLIVAHDVDARRRAELEVQIRAAQQAAISSLGQRALAGIDFQLLSDQTVALVAHTLRIAAAGVCERTNAGPLLLKAGVGWRHATIGETCLSGDSTRYPAAVLVGPGGILVSAAADRTPRDPAIEHEAFVSSAAVVIPGRSTGYGILLAGATEPRTFTRDDVHFLQAAANVIGAAFDRAAIERDLRTELALHAATLEAAAEGILVTDAANRVTRYNRRMVDMWGYPPEVTASDRAEDWIAWGLSRVDDPAQRQADFRRASASDTVDHAVITFKDGRVFERHAQPQIVDGAVVGHVWSYRDLTERVRAEEERRRLEARMLHGQKLESLGVLAGGIAHDFNNLLVGMLGNAGLALADVPSGSPLHERLREIETAAQRAAELTNQLLAYSGRGRFVMRRVDLSEHVRELATLLRTAVGRNVELELRLDASLPAFDGDPAQIRQVIMNLITNAAESIGDGAGRILVTTGRMFATHAYLAEACVGQDLPEREYVFAEVLDNGCGMDAATLARIFDPFFTTKVTGHGLGLAAALGIVRSHHGAIVITSALGHGTCFRVLLPAALEITAIPQPSDGVPASGASMNAAGWSALIVDDDPAVRRIACESLRRAGFQVETADDGEGAVALVRGRDCPFDAVLVDMTMPRMSGVETCQALKAMQPDLPLILTSGYSEEDAMLRFAPGTIAGFVHKPFQPAALVRVMRQAVLARGDAGDEQRRR